MEYLEDFFGFLERNPSQSTGVLILAVVVVLYLRDRLNVPTIKSNAETADVQSDMLQGLTTVITLQTTSIKDSLAKFELFMETLIKQYKTSNDYFEKIVSAGQAQLISTEKWLGTIGEGFTGVVRSHEEKTDGRFQNVESFILQNSSAMVDLRQELFGVKMAINDLALRLPIPPPKGEDTQPMLIVPSEDKPNEP